MEPVETDACWAEWPLGHPVVVVVLVVQGKVVLVEPGQVWGQVVAP